MRVLDYGLLWLSTKDKFAVDCGSSTCVGSRGGSLVSGGKDIILVYHIFVIYYVFDSHWFAVSIAIELIYTINR